mmetsp:Transcript_98589/g.283375  ORF Transcript_98589/g.283375 Transcript_98589/m.283375 type:complete len:216 (+) Transcript_98589:129-776(+)
MWPPAIDDVRGGDASIEGRDHASDLRDHASGDNAFFDEFLRGGDVELLDQRARVFHVPHDARHIRHQNELARIQRAGDGCRRRVGIHVEEVALLISGHRGDHRHQAVLKGSLQNLNVRTGDLADEAQFLVVHLTCLEQAAIHASEAHSPDACRPHRRHDSLVDLAHEDHGNNLHRGSVCHAKAAHKLGLDANLRQPRVDLRPTPMHEHRFQAERS